MKPSITVITASLNKKCIEDCVRSVADQTVEVKHHVIMDGVSYLDTLPERKNLRVTVLGENVGAGGYYGHRIYCAYGMLATTPYVSFLDEDCTLEPTWAETMLKSAERLPMVTCRRNIVYNGVKIGVDNKESIGRNEYNYTLYDINTFLMAPRVVALITPFLYATWGADRDVSEFFYDAIHHIPQPLVNYTVRDDRIEFYRSIL